MIARDWSERDYESTPGPPKYIRDYLVLTRDPEERPANFDFRESASRVRARSRPFHYREGRQRGESAGANWRFLGPGPGLT